MAWLQDLRRAYPTIDTRKFIEIVEKHSGDDRLLELLDAAELEARQKQAEQAQEWEELRQRLAVGEQHTRLHFVVGPDTDLLHAQAILAYGFLMPGRQMVYSGLNVVAAEHVRVNVRNKLVGRFSQEKFQGALHYLVAEGVVTATGTKNRRAYAINLGSKGQLTSHGRLIVDEANRFLRQT